MLSAFLSVLFVPLGSRAQRHPGGASIGAQILNAHNAVRRSVGVPPLGWSEELERSAQRWARDLISTGEFSHSRNQQYGQNLFEISGASAAPSEVVANWAAERKNYDPRTNTCSSRCGHYTQIVWRDTKLLGCAVARNRTREVWVCDYEPPGNFIGERPY